MIGDTMQGFQTFFPDRVKSLFKIYKNKEWLPCRVSS